MRCGFPLSHTVAGQQWFPHYLRPVTGGRAAHISLGRLGEESVAVGGAGGQSMGELLLSAEQLQPCGRTLSRAASTWMLRDTGLEVKFMAKASGMNLLPRLADGLRQGFMS